MANRKTFPALVGTSLALALAEVKREYLLVPKQHLQSLSLRQY
jgi:hypothetical protein